MIDDELVLKVERLRDSLNTLSQEIRRRYKKPNRPVADDALREQAARLAEVWMVDIATREDVRLALGDTAADLSVSFQQLLRYADHHTLRKKYDDALRTVRKDFRTQVVLPLKQARNVVTVPLPAPIRRPAGINSVFVGHSFAPTDGVVTKPVIDILVALGLQVRTGEKPRAESVSKKVRQRIEGCDAFLGVFTKREQLAGQEAWNTSAWVIDEKAYAFAKDKKLYLLKEAGVDSIGGLQGDHEYVEFDRSHIPDLLVNVVQILRDQEGH